MENYTYYESYNNYPAWNSVVKARKQNRPQTRDIIENITDTFFEVKGDRTFEDDKSIVTGIGKIAGQRVTIIGQQKGKTIAEKKECNFGMPQPAGYRKSMRAIKQAEKFGRPIVCLIDTPGAFCGISAEEQGQGSIIAEHLSVIAAAKVPVISIVIGEGGSGGALALALGDKLVLLENSYFSVISPEGCASILFKDVSKAKEAAESLQLTAAALKKLGVADMVIKEKANYDDENMMYTTLKMKEIIIKYLNDLCRYSQEELIENRYNKYLSMKGKVR